MTTTGPWARTGRVALRKESVDRNNVKCARHIDVQASLSARRAWIEITMNLRISICHMSLSARRAWIEICVRLGSLVWALGRSPQGERG